MPSEPGVNFPVLDPAGYAFSAYAIPTFAATAVLLLLGFVVLLHEHASRVSRLFALVTLTVAGWLFAFSWMYSAANEQVALWWAKAAYIAVPSIAPAIYHFSAVALQIYPRCRRLVWTGWMLSAAFTAAIVGTDLLIGGLYHYSWGYYPKYGWLAVPYLVFFFGLMLASLRNYWVEYQAAAPGTKKHRIKIFMSAYVFAFIATFDYAAKFGVPLYPFGYLAVLGWLGLVAAAIWRHQFVDITPAFAADEITTTMRDALLVFDHEGIVRVVNRAAGDLFNRPEAELIGKPLSQISEEVFPKETIWILLQTGSIRNYEASYQPAEGGALSVEVSASIIRDRAGQPLAIVCLLRDVTERKRAEEALREFSEFNQQIIAGAREGIIVYDRDLKYAVWNPFMEELTGLSAMKVLGRHPLELFPFLREQGIYVLLEKALTGEHAMVTDVNYAVPLTGRSGWMSGTYGPLRNTKGDIIGVIGMVSDITERKRAEESIRANEARFRSVAQTANDAIVSADEDGNILYWNRGAQAMFGYDEAEVLGQPLTRLMPERYREAHQQGVARMRAGGEAHVIGKTVELHGLTKDGEEFPLELSLATWKMGGNSFYSGILRDTTERKHLEEQLRQSQKMEAVGRLAGGIAHDFNNLLMVITGYSHMLLDRLSEGDEMRADVLQIKEAGDRAASLTKQLLAFSRKQVLKLETLDLGAIVAGMGQMLKRLIGEDVYLIIVPSPTLGSVKADRGQIEQVIMNLAVNARDAMPQGGQLTIETANLDVGETSAGRYLSLQAGSYVMLAVTDTGCGMDQATQARIFEPFFTTKEQGKGTGLGLSTVYGIVEQCRGTIMVASEPGRGTTFKICLPRIEDDVKPLEAAPVAAAFIPAFDTILLVEDEDMVRALLARILRAHGFSVLEARSGREALQLAREHAGPIRLLITDMVMPGMNGRELAERMLPARPDMKVLFISGYLDDSVIRRDVMESQATFLQKPLVPDTLVRTVQELLRPAPEDRSPHL